MIIASQTQQHQQQILITPMPVKPKCAAGVYDCKLCYYNKTCSHDIYLCRDAFLYTSAGESLCCENFSMNNRHCTHGGGLVCSKWRSITKRMLDKGKVKNRDGTL